MNQPIWKKTTAKISLKQERSIGLFKKKYFFALMYYVVVEQAISKEEMERIKQNKSLIKSLEKNLPTFDNSEQFIDTDQIIVQDTPNTTSTRRLYVQDLEVTKAVYKKYEKAKNLMLEYDGDNPYSIRVVQF